MAVQLNWNEILRRCAPSVIVLFTASLCLLPLTAFERTRVAEPDAAAKQAAERAIKAVLKDDYAAAQRDAGARGALALKLLKLGIDEKKRNAEVHVCLRDARDFGARAGDYKTAVEAVDTMAEGFDVDALDMKATALETAQRALPANEAAAGFADVLFDLVDEAVAGDRYDVAIRLATTMEAAVEKTKSSRIAPEAKEKKKWVLDAKAEYRRIEKERDLLANNPSNSAASLAVGKFLCFWKDDWTRGLPLLERGADAAFNTLAAFELESPRAPSEQVNLADRWWEFAKFDTSTLKPRIQKRAVHWYRAALPRLEGLAEARVVKLMDEYRAEHPGAEPREVYISDLKETESSVGFGTLGKKGQLGYVAMNNPAYTKIVVNGKESPNGISMCPPTNGSAHATHDIGRKYRMFRAEVAIVDASLVPPSTPVTFMVVGDGKPLWSSKPVGKVRQVERCQVRLAGIKVLRLEVECPGSNARAYAVWIEPALEPW